MSSSYSQPVNQLTGFYVRGQINWKWIKTVAVSPATCELYEDAIQR